MTALKSIGYPVPNTIHLCQDDAIIGTPFYLYEYTRGICHKDPTLPNMDPLIRTKVLLSMNEVWKSCMLFISLIEILTLI